MRQEDLYQAMYYKFVTEEVAKGHPVIVTYLKPLSPGRYIKRSFVVTQSGNPTHHQSLQFLTPNGRFETYNSLGERTPTWGEVMQNDPVNPLGALLARGAGSPFAQQPSASNEPLWKGVTYDANQEEGRRGSATTSPRFEVYSLGFE
jgi:hypothetical protein